MTRRLLLTATAAFAIALAGCSPKIDGFAGVKFGDRPRGKEKFSNKMLMEFIPISNGSLTGDVCVHYTPSSRKACYISFTQDKKSIYPDLLEEIRLAFEGKYNIRFSYRMKDEDPYTRVNYKREIEMIPGFTTLTYSYEDDRVTIEIRLRSKWDSKYRAIEDGSLVLKKLNEEFVVFDITMFDKKLLNQSEMEEKKADDALYKKMEGERKEKERVERERATKKYNDL